MARTTTTEIPRPVAEEPADPHMVRVPNTLWKAARDVAAAEGLDVSKVVRHYLQHYVDTAKS